MNLTEYEKNIKKYKICAIFSNHTNTIHKYNLSLNNIQYIHRNVDEIIIVDSLNEKYAEYLKDSLSFDTKIKKYIFLNNTIYYDIGKWCHVLNTTDLSSFDYILFINDSILITHSNINNYFKHLNQYINSNIYAFNDSTQLEYHYQSYLFFLHTSILHKLVNLFEENKKNIYDYDSLVYNIELKLYKIDESRKCFIELGLYYNKGLNIFWENEKLYKNLLSKNVFMLIKLKKIYEYHNNYSYPVHYDIPNYFNPDYYRKQYPELSYLDNDYLGSHFYYIGQHEGRKCIKDYSYFLPLHYRNKLNEMNMLHLYDVPDDFDIYYYKKWNPDIENLSPKELMIHYIENGIYENRRYNISRDFSNYLIYYLNYLSYYNCIDLNNITISPFFNHIYYLKLYPNKKYNDPCNLILDYLSQDETVKNNFNMNDIISTFPPSWDMEIYKSFYPFLKNWSDNEILKEYWNVGVYSNRSYFFPSDFNTDMYKKLYPFLYNKTDEELKDHFLKNGFSENKIYKIPNDFIPIVYKSFYPDLMNYSDDFLIKHYLYYGLHEGRLYKLPKDFDPLIYKELNEDLKDMNNEELIKHFTRNGINEKRVYKYKNLPFNFNPWIYRDINPELHSITNSEDLENHFIVHGIKQNLYYKINLNYNYEKDTIDPVYIRIDNNIVYLEQHQELNKKFESIQSSIQIKNESLKESIHNEQSIETIETIETIEINQENKIDYHLPIDFSSDEYIQLNPDLKVLISDYEIKKHYMEHGIYENRKYKDSSMYDSLLPNNFICAEYVRLNPDLKHLTNDFDIKKHYIENGILEKRVYFDPSAIPNDFHPTIYKNLNSDLENMNDNNELIKHYLEFGKKENRNYIKKNYHSLGSVDNVPSDFNYKVYKTLWNDVIDINDPEKIKEHYLNIGQYENRMYKLPDDFSPNNYKNYNSDLDIENDNQAVHHYIHIGHRENRIYKLPDDFNTKQYLQLNPDLNGMMSYELKEHFVNYGFIQNRKYK